MGTLKIIVGGQYGSEAKGTIAAHLARTTTNPLLAVRVAGPNAGHTVYDTDGKAWPLRTIPVAAVANRGAALAIAAGSEIDRDVLEHERQELNNAGHDIDHRLRIDNQATLLTPEHIQYETGDRLHERLGSTGKGIGAARAARILRKADLYGGTYETDHEIRKHLRNGGEVHIEGTQGYGLGLHAGDYPFSTSSNCRAIDFCAMAGISPWDEHIDTLEIWIVFRTYPIRVAGNSGPLHQEITFEQLSRALGKHIEPERTTVTKKIRRIGTWDDRLAMEAITANGNRNLKLALTFVDYLHQDAYGATQYHHLPIEVRDWIEETEQYLGHQFTILCTGPQTLIDRSNEYR